YFGEQLAAHFVAGCFVEPVQEPANGGGLAEKLVSLEAHAGEVLFHVGNAFQLVALPTAKAQCASGFYRPILGTPQRRWGRRGALKQAGVVGEQGTAKGFQARGRNQWSQSVAPHFPPAFHDSVS